MLTGRHLPTAVVNVALLIGSAAQPSVAQPTVGELSLRLDSELAEPYSQISAIHELRDGRVLVVDGTERVVRLVDQPMRNVAQIGRSGDGPREYRAPVTILPLPGDSSVIFDGGRTGLLLVGPDGTLGDFVSTAHLSNRSTEGAAGRFVMSATRFVPSRGDASGNLYATGAPFMTTANGLAPLDSYPIVRWDRHAEGPLTVGFLRTRSPRDRGADVDPVRAIVTSLVPFIVGDQWAVARDGRIAVVRYDDYRVDFITPAGEFVRGEPIPFERIRVGDQHKQEWRDAERARIAGGPSRFVEPPRWPEYLPPFLSRPALFAPDGTLWVQRTAPTSDAVHYDLIDRNGRLASRVVLPARTRVIGFGSRLVYAVRRDTDDLEYLQRYSVP